MTEVLDKYASVALTSVDLRNLAMSSREFFIEYFLAEEIDATVDTQDFHILIFNRFVDLTCSKDVMAIPRGHAKTTYLRLAFVYLIFFSDIDFFIYLSATHSAAAASLQVVWDTVVSVEAQDMFEYPLEIVKHAPSDGWYEFKVNAYNPDGTSFVKHVILRAVGQGQALRGMNLRKRRPQYAGVDDVEDETAVRTKAGYEKLKAWFDNTFMRALDKRKFKVAQIGNLIAPQTLLNDNLKDPDWRSLLLGAIRANGEPLWPSLWSKEALKADIQAALRRGQISAWMGEMMNIPANVEHGLIAGEAIVYTPRRSHADNNVYYSFITVDPAISKSAYADECAIVLHTINTAGVCQQTEYVHRQGMQPEDMADVIKDMCARWGTRVVGVESVQLQAVLLDYFALVFESDGLTRMEFVPIRVGRTHKTERLRLYASLLKLGETTLPEGDWDITQQLLAFDTQSDSNLDDLIDACSMFNYMLDNHRDVIYSSRASAALSQRKIKTIGEATCI